MTDLAWFYRRESRDGRGVVALMSRRQMQSLWEIIVNPFWSYQGVIKLGVWLNNIKTTWRLIYNKCGNTFICKDCPTNMSLMLHFDKSHKWKLFYDFISKIQGDILNTLKYLKMTYLSHLKTAERHSPKNFNMLGRYIFDILVVFVPEPKINPGYQSSTLVTSLRCW